MCLRSLRAITCLRAFASYVPYAPSFFTCLHFLRALRALFFVRALLAFIFLRTFIFLRAYILLIYMLINFTRVNEVTYDYSSLLLLNSVVNVY